MVAKKKNPTLQDVLEAVSDFAHYVEQRFDSIDKRLDKLDERMSKLDERMSKLEGRVGRLEAAMVTKDYLDTKLADLRGDLVVMMRKEDTKLGKLITILADKKVINAAEQRQLTTMEPFAQL